MKLKTLWIQRTCGYEGEYAPECLAVVDEYNYNESSLWFDKECIRLLVEVKDCISSHKIIDIEVDQEQIAKLLNDISSITGEIK